MGPTIRTSAQSTQAFFLGEAHICFASECVAAMYDVFALQWAVQEQHRDKLNRLCVTDKFVLHMRYRLHLLQQRPG